MFKSLVKAVMRGFTPQSAPQNSVPPKVREQNARFLQKIADLKQLRDDNKNNPELTAESRAFADQRLVELLSSTIQQVKALQEAYPDLKPPVKTAPKTVIIKKYASELSRKLSREFADAASRGFSQAVIVATPYAQSAKRLAEEKLIDLGARVVDVVDDLYQEARYFKNEIVRDIECELSVTLPSLPQLSLPSWARGQNVRLTAGAGSLVMAFGLVAGGIALHQKNAQTLSASRTDVAQSAAYDIEPPTQQASVSYPSVDNAFKAALQVRKAVYIPPSEGQKSTGKWGYTYGNLDVLFSEKYIHKVVVAADRLMKMHPEDVFQGAILTESGGNQFDKYGNPLKSTADAYGIAQVLIPTARLIAVKCTGEPLNIRKFLRDPVYNAQLGECYYKEQHENFGNNVFALLAYNSGPGDDKGRSGLTRNIRRSGIDMDGTAESMVELMRHIDNQENRHYVLKTMFRLGLLNPNEFPDILQKLPSRTILKAKWTKGSHIEDTTPEGIEPTQEEPQPTEVAFRTDSEKESSVSLEPQ